MTHWAFVWMWIGWYLLTGLVVETIVPKPPMAEQAFRMAEEAHPSGRLFVRLIVSVFWPIVLIGTIRRAIFKRRK